MPQTEYNKNILKSLRRIIQAVDIQSKKLSNRSKITGQQLACLRLLLQEEKLTVKDISNRIYISSGTLVGILDRLEKKGLIQREKNKTDRRKLDVSITDEGRKVSEATPNPLQDLFDTLAQLPDMEKATIAFSLEKVANMMNAPKKKKPPKEASDISSII